MKSAHPFAQIQLARLLAGAGTVIFAVLWLNNLVAAWQYHAALFQGGKAAAEAATGLFACLKWSAADVSTVSTLIPFFGFLMMSAGFRRIRNMEDWPFFAGYDRFNVALGLIGTLWGIILIGYYPASEVSVAALMSCLHTAMYSTLIAVIWVMVLEPVLFRPWLNAVRNAAAPELADASMQEIMDSLMQGMNAANRAVAGMAESAAGFQQEVDGLNRVLGETRLAETERAEKITVCLQNMNALLTGFQTMEAQLAADHQNLLTEKNALNEALAARQTELSAMTEARQQEAVRAETLQGELKQSLQTQEALQAQTVQLDAKKQELDARLAELETQNRQLTSQLAAIREALK